MNNAEFVTYRGYRFSIQPPMDGRGWEIRIDPLDALPALAHIGAAVEREAALVRARSIVDAEHDRLDTNRRKSPTMLGRLSSAFRAADTL